MNKLFRELERRNVFRIGGFYLGIAWVCIEASSVILPELNAPKWVLRGIIGLAVAGFPVALVLAWVYEITSEGIERDEDVDRSATAGRGRQFDFVVIGVLVVALTVSVYLNIVSRRAPVVIDALPLLIADFDNQTGEPLFDGSIEQALTIGLEGAPFVTAYPRKQALSAAAAIRTDGTTRLDSEVALLIGVREDLGGVLIGTIESVRSGYRLQARVVEPGSQENLARASVSADSKLDVLAAVGELAEDLRSDLGDVTVGERDELITVASLEAAKAYAVAQDLHFEGNDLEAIEKYRTATELDPEFGRAFAGWAFAESRLGRVEKSEALWEKALALLDRMTERERYRTLGLYYLTVSNNYEKAVENYTELVERYPADSGGHNNLAVAHFYLRQFDRALEEGARAVEIYPSRVLFRVNYALYALYASQFETAVTEADEALATDPGYHKAYLAKAIAAADRLDTVATLASYQEMSKTGVKGASLAVTGLADLAIFQGRYDDAVELLQSGIAADRENNNDRGVARKLMMLSEAFAALGREQPSQQSMSDALSMLRRPAELYTAAQIQLDQADVAGAQAIADELAQSLRPQRRAYARVIEAQIARDAGDLAAAADSLRQALLLSDLWIAHYELGLVYAAAGDDAEALSEFQTCHDRRGEAYALFLDDVPTLRYTAHLPYWLGRSAEALGMQADANTNYQRFLALRTSHKDDPLVQDASVRLRQN